MISVSLGALVALVRPRIVNLTVRSKSDHFLRFATCTTSKEPRALSTQSFKQTSQFTNRLSGDHCSSYIKDCHNKTLVNKTNYINTMEMIRRASQQHNNGSPARVSPSGAERKRPFLIGVAGGTASGKSTVCDRIIQAVKSQNTGTDKAIISLSQDSFYRDLNEEEIEKAKKGTFNFDHPDAFDHELLLNCLQDIREGKPTQIPVYDFKKNARVANESKTIQPSDVVLLEGILIFYFRDVLDMFDMKLFVDTDADTRLARRVLRDIEERGRDLEHILFQYTTLVKPAFEEFCLPTKKCADVIIPRGAENTVAIELVAQHIQDIIWAKNCSSKSGSPFSRSRSNSDSMIR